MHDVHLLCGARRLWPNWNDLVGVLCSFRDLVGKKFKFKA